MEVVLSSEQLQDGLLSTVLLQVKPLHGISVLVPFLRRRLSTDTDRRCGVAERRVHLVTAYRNEFCELFANYQGCDSLVNAEYNVAMHAVC